MSKWCIVRTGGLSRDFEFDEKVYGPFDSEDAARIAVATLPLNDDGEPRACGLSYAYEVVPLVSP